MAEDLLGTGASLNHEAFAQGHTQAGWEVRSARLLLAEERSTDARKMK